MVRERREVRMVRELTLRDGTPAMVWSLSPSDSRWLAEAYLQRSDASLAA